MSGGSLYLLDTNVAAYIVSGRSDAARQRWKDVRDHSMVGISAITQGEILFGLENKPEATRLRFAVEELLGKMQILAWDSITAQAYGKLRARLGAAGKSLSTMDMLIAAHAVAVGAILVTRDRALLQAGPLLEIDVVNWAEDV